MEVSSVYGTRPYLPIEFLARRTLSTKIDTFSYGVVLFELMTGLRAYDKNRGLENAYLTKYMFAICKSSEPIQNFLDKSLNVNDVPLALFENLFKVALICTVENAQQRPEMVDVLNHLEKHIDHESTFAWKWTFRLLLTIRGFIEVTKLSYYVSQKFTNLFTFQIQKFNKYILKYFSRYVTITFLTKNKYIFRRFNIVQVHNLAVGIP